VPQPLAGGQDPVLVPAGEQLRAVENGVRVVVVDILGATYQQVRGGLEPIHVHENVAAEPEGRVADLQHRRQLRMPVPQSPEQGTQPAGRHLVGVVRPQGSGNLGSRARSVQSQEGDQVLRIGWQLDRRAVDRTRTAGRARPDGQGPIAQQSKLRRARQC
jgi:hypothetical protein